MGSHDSSLRCLRLFRTNQTLQAARVWRLGSGKWEVRSEKYLSSNTRGIPLPVRLSLSFLHKFTQLDRNLVGTGKEASTFLYHGAWLEYSG